MATSASHGGSDTKAMEGRVLNINLGILGHVDSGKTSLSMIPYHHCHPLALLPSLPSLLFLLTNLITT
jgi:hypothetical protein